MARQAATPIQFNRSVRRDTTVAQTSGRAGVVHVVDFIPLLRGDSCAGRFGIDIDLAEMPRPLLNGVMANIQIWFAPKSAFPHFSGLDEFRHAYQGETIKALGGDKLPPAFFTKVEDGPSLATVAGSTFFKTLGIHLAPGEPINTDLINAAVLVYNFRLAAHSSRLERQKYFEEDPADALAPPRAFWPSDWRSGIVPDYERALIVGALDLDVLSGQLPLTGFFVQSGDASPSGTTSQIDADGNVINPASRVYKPLVAHRAGSAATAALATGLHAELTGQKIGITLADIDKARTSQAFAKLRTAYAGNDSTGFDNDDVIVADLMQGFGVEESAFKRPWLLSSERVTFGMSERFSTDAEALDVSVTQGRASAVLNINVPGNDHGGVIIVTLEVLPERIDERQSDEWLHITDTAQLPDALRDVQRPEPVDLVKARRIDAKHSAPNSLYGYEPMNNVWNRVKTRLGGAFYQATPGSDWTEQRSALWLANIIDPEFTEDHFLAPAPFPHDVFALSDLDAFEVTLRHEVAIVGLTQIGDVLSESNDDYAAVLPEETEE